MKSEIRSKYKLIRSQLTEYEVRQKSRDASAAFLSGDIYKNSRCIMLYMPLRNETDTSDIIKAAFRDGKKVVFPVTDSVGGVITPYYADAGTEFAAGAFSVREPCSGSVAKPTDIDVVLVPGIAFDAKGARVGFGKGCYDRFLQNTSAVKVGFCYGFQICDKIPADAHDVRMDYLATENGIIKCNN